MSNEPTPAEVERSVIPPKGCVSGKLGTIPALLQFDRRSRFEVGGKVRFRTPMDKKNMVWQQGILNDTDPVKVSLM